LVARYLRESNLDQVDRAIALHDYLAMRVAYDPTADWRMTLDKTDLDPRHVFAQRRGNSVGYADLVTALGTAAGLFVLTADGCDSGGKPHSWNLFWLQGDWWSVDVALDRTSSGRLKRDHFLFGEAAFHRLGFDAESLWIRAADGMRLFHDRSTPAPQIPCSPEMGLTECTRVRGLALHATAGG
jgi:transglutaminase-like putative cysteine protease